MESRTCRTCGTAKPLDAFFRDAGKPLGRRYRCKACEQPNPRPVYVDAPGRKVCRRCKCDKDHADFSSHSNARDGLQSWCKVCQNELRAQRYRAHSDEENARHRLDRATNPDKQLDRTLRKRYGITLAEFRAMAEEQDGRCGLCVEPAAKLIVDHCHKTSRVRKLLCYRCNILVGYIEGRPELVGLAQQYVAAF